MLWNLPIFLFLFNFADYLYHQYYIFYIMQSISSTYIRIIYIHGESYKWNPPLYYFCSTWQIIPIINIIFSIFSILYHLRISISYLYVEKIGVPLFVISVQLGRLSLSSILYFLCYPYHIIYVNTYHIYTWRWLWNPPLYYFCSTWQIISIINIKFSMLSILYHLLKSISDLYMTKVMKSPLCYFCSTWQIIFIINIIFSMLSISYNLCKSISYIYMEKVMISPSLLFLFNLADYL